MCILTGSKSWPRAYPGFGFCSVVMFMWLDFPDSLMRIIDVPDAYRVGRTPDGVKVLLSSGNFVQDGFVVRRVELRLYETDKTRGKYSLITSFVDTDRGSIEMVYDEGYMGNRPLARTAEFLVSQMGLSPLVLRSIIAIRSRL